MTDTSLSRIEIHYYFPKRRLIKSAGPKEQIPFSHLSIPQLTDRLARCSVPPSTLENSETIKRTLPLKQVRRFNRTPLSTIRRKERNQRERMRRKNTIERVAIFWKLFGPIQQSNRLVMKRKAKGQKVSNGSVEKSIPKLKASEELGWKFVFRFYPIC
jgi:hypothetical protein